jgi:hypothetical protein
VETGQSEDASLKVNVQCYVFESAWAMGAGEGVTAAPSSDFGFSNCGPTSSVSPTPVSGRCTPEPPSPTFDPGHKVDGEAVSAGKDPFPKLRSGAYTSAPGQYKIMKDLSGEIYVIAHANVEIPDPDFGPSVK